MSRYAVLVKNYSSAEKLVAYAFVHSRVTSLYRRNGLDIEALKLEANRWDYEFEDIRIYVEDSEKLMAIAKNIV